MNPAVFRKAAIEKAEAAGDRPDEVLSISRPRDWLALLVIGLLILAAGAWADQGRIATKSEGQGILVLSGGVVNAFAESSGRVLSVGIRPGDIVQKNQVIGTVAQPSIQDKVKTLLASRAELERERARVTDSRNEGDRLQNEVLANQRANLERDIEEAHRQIKLLDEQLRVEEELLSKGLITRQQVLATQQKRASAENSIAVSQGQMKQLEANRFQSQMQGAQADRESAARLSELDRSIQSLEHELSNATAIRSAYSGKVIEVKVYPGALITAGEAFASLEPQAESIEAIVYVPASKAKEIRAGLQGEIVPASVKREEYGFIRSRVLSVAEFPATKTAMMRNFENETLVASLAGGGPVHEVRMALEQDRASASGFKWSSSSGPQLRISSGTLCTASIVTRQQRPIEMVIPSLRKKVGL